MKTDHLYNFWARGFLGEQALTEFRAAARNPEEDEKADRVRRALPIDEMDEEQTGKARSMALVYTAIAASENTARDYAADVPLESDGADWREKRASGPMKDKAKKRIQTEERLKYHTPRGGRPIDYVDFADLANLIANSWSEFTDYLPSQEWAKSLFEILENSRNIIMHSGTLDTIDVERVGIHIRDWIHQVGV